MSRRSISSVASALLFALTLVSCGDDEGEEVNTVEVTEPVANLIEELDGVNLGDIGARDRRTWVRLVNDILSPCGEPISVAQCVQDGRTCSDCAHEARYIARLVGEGYESTEIREIVRARYGEESLIDLDIEGNPVRGAEMGAPITIVEFSDFECPFCGRAHPLLQRVLRTFEGRIRMVFKHYPLSMHQHAEPAARAAFAAMRQDKFWQMHDMLFENADALTDSDLESYAQELGLDMDRFRADFASEEAAAFVLRDRDQGRELGVNSTPTIYINGRKFEEPHENLEIYIREELQRQQ